MRPEIKTGSASGFARETEPEIETIIDNEKPQFDPKESNPKQAIGTKKAPMSTVSAVVLAELGVAMLSGALKYGRHNYRVAGARASTYYDALNRHISAWWEGEDTDPESGEPHIMMAMGCIAVLRDAQIHGVETDDRPPKAPAGWLTELNMRAAKLIEECESPVSAFTEKGQTEPEHPKRPVRIIASQEEADELFGKGKIIFGKNRQPTAEVKNPEPEVLTFYDSYGNKAEARAHSKETYKWRYWRFGEWTSWFMSFLSGLDDEEALHFGHADEIRKLCENWEASK